jgi:RNA recognition motif-containing protein
MKILIRGLPKDVEEQIIQEHFSTFGKVECVLVMKERMNQDKTNLLEKPISKGTAFVDVNMERKGAEKAISIWREASFSIIKQTRMEDL